MNADKPYWEREWPHCPYCHEPLGFRATGKKRDRRVGKCPCGYRALFDQTPSAWFPPAHCLGAYFVMGKEEE